LRSLHHQWGRKRGSRLRHGDAPGQNRCGDGDDPDSHRVQFKFRDTNLVIRRPAAPECSSKSRLEARKFCNTLCPERVCTEPGDYDRRGPRILNMSKASTQKILVVDDDQRLRDLLRRYLTENGFTVYTADGAAAMNKLWLRERFDLLILDLMMPGEDGLSVLRRLRGGNDPTPILMLTAKGEDVDRIVGLEMGADDYLPKPFNPRELLARINAIFRRKAPAELPGAPSQEATSVVFGDFVLDLATRTLTRGGEPVALTTGEFAVLKVFARFPKVPLSREKLMEMARGREYEAFDRSLDVQISRLRKLIEPDPSKPRFIQTVWGLGYVFIPDGTA
jgi:two-component system phosphate regulon response regulator OmpR